MLNQLITLGFPQAHFICLATPCQGLSVSAFLHLDLQTNYA
jgi:hypothetical protein